MIREPGQPDRFARQMPRASQGVRSPGFSRQSATKPPEGGTTNGRTAYRLTDLGTLGGTMSKANAINAAGQAVGESATSGGAVHAFLYNGGKMRDLGTLGNGNSCANGINAAGQMVGRSGSGSADCLAFLYSGGRMTSLGTLGGPTDMRRRYQ